MGRFSPCPAAREGAGDGVQAGRGPSHTTLPATRMLRAALIGLPSTGRTTLFHLMTAGHESAARGHGRAEASIGVSKVPDARLDRLTAMYNPRKRVPATIEFADIAGAALGAQALVDVAAYRNADALVHLVRAFRDESVPHVSG